MRAVIDYKKNQFEKLWSFHTILVFKEIVHTNLALLHSKHGCTRPDAVFPPLIQLLRVGGFFFNILV